MFRITARDQRPEDLLGLATFSFSLPSINYGDRRKAIFEEIAGKGSWNQFQQDGTFNTDVFSWLVNYHEIRPMILEEFACYRYHLREKNGRSNRGWGRNMVHSMIQQVIRQDPVYFMLSAAARPDANYSLISYPYYVADKRPQDSTVFRHLDLSPGRYIRSAGTQGAFSSPNSPYPWEASMGRRGLTIQGGVAIDHETADEGCTEVIKGFHKVMSA